jgi:adenylylsulfate kinase
VGATVLLTGLPSAGKSTIADGVAACLRAERRPAEVLDGDELRRRIAPDLGFGAADRRENLRRIGYVAALLARHGVTVLMPVIAPYAASRAELRASHTSLGVPFVEVHVATPLEVCRRRDVKGLYRRQRAGRMRGLTGVDDVYEVPIDPELRVPAHEQTIEESVAMVRRLLSDLPGRRR